MRLLGHVWKWHTQAATRGERIAPCGMWIVWTCWRNRLRWAELHEARASLPVRSGVASEVCLTSHDLGEALALADAMNDDGRLWAGRTPREA